MAFRNQNIKYVHYISNYDMPIRPINKIYEFYEKKAGGRSFLNCHANGDRKQMRAMADTTYGYYYYLYNENENDPAVKEQINASIESQKRMGISRNALGEFTDLYKGVIWSSLSREAYLYCRDYAETHPEYVNDIKFTRLRTEFFFHTILFNSDRLREKIVSGIRGGKHGWFWNEKRRDYKTLTFESYQVLKQDEQYLFARKVTSQDRKLIELILKDIKSPYKYKLE